ncbi:MAG TPA: sulfotransferase [Thermoanaerobaculia bacterium]|nr:sulfotransferase [Thermoanaerobaculia bacterium]
MDDGTAASPSPHDVQPHDVQPHDVQAWFEAAVEHDRNADAPAALEAARRTLLLAPRHLGAEFLIARALTAVGRIDEAAETYRRLTRRSGAEARAWFGLLDLKTVPLEADELRALERLARRPSNSQETKVLVHFALGQAYEMAGRPVDAVRAFDIANRLQRRRTPWSAEAFSHAVDVTLEEFPEPAPDTGSRRGAAVTFVLGMPRSGTTLVEHILAAHSQVTGASELPDIGLILADESIRRGKPFPTWVGDADAGDWQRLGEEYLARTARWQGRVLFTDKMPENWLYLGAILRMLPGARVIRCSRAPLETAWSCYKQLFAPGMFGWSYDFDSLAAYTVDEERQWQHFARQHPQRCRTQAHEALLADFAGQVRELLAFVGLPYEPACLEFSSAPQETRTASAAQVRKPLNTSTARRNLYGPALDPLARALARAVTID